jgi:VWFA-related protein
MKALSQIAELSDTLDSFLSRSGNQIAILTFDGSPHLIQEFTSDPEMIGSTLGSISKGNSHAALFDALNLAIGYFRRAPADDQKVIFLISGEHDHGSVEYDMKSLLRAANSSDVSIDSFSFRSGGVELFGRFHAINPLNMATSAMEKNTVATLAELTGGEFFRFSGEADLQNCADRAASHIRSRYILTFEPSSPQPGFHALQVAVQAPGAKIASARESYWISQAAAP